MSYNITIVKYEVKIKKKVGQGLLKLPSDIQKLFFLLIADLQTEGPIQTSWSNFSKLEQDQYHCHLNYRYVACWTCQKNAITIEVYYAGSREKAPY